MGNFSVLPDLAYTPTTSSLANNLYKSSSEVFFQFGSAICFILLPITASLEKGEESESNSGLGTCDRLILYYGEVLLIQVDIQTVSGESDEQGWSWL